MNSRIIVRNLPKNIDEKSLKLHFSKFGEVTDVKLIFKGNMNRRFCFIGFKSPDVCKKSKEYFDKTYINTSKIVIEYAMTKDQLEEQPEHKGSNKRKTEELVDQKKGKKQKTDKNDVNEMIKKEIPEDKKEKFNEFLQLMKAQSKATMSWNDDVVKKQKQKEEVQNLDQFEENQNKKTKKQKKEEEKKQQKESKEEIKGEQLVSENQNKQNVSEMTPIDTKRLYVLNLPYEITEEEIKSVFSPYGTVTELKMPKDKDKKFTGFVFITYEIEEEAMRAFSELDNKVVFGRILHVRPAYENKRKKEIEERLQKKAEFEQNQEKTSYKKDKRILMRKRLNDTTSWNTLFLNPNTILEEISTRFNIQKSDILAAEDSNLAVRQAQAETQIINETKEWMKSQGLNLEFMERDRVSCERSDTVILVKNLSHKVTEDILRETFSHFGQLDRVLMAPNKAIGLVQFSSNTHALNAFQNLSYQPLKHNPLYLEWAPIDLVEKDEETNNQNTQDQNGEKRSKKSKAGGKILPDEEEIDKKDIIQNILYVKNLNFETDVKDLKELFENAQVGQVKSCKIAKKPDGKSAGFGFLEFNNHDAVEKSIKKLQNVILDGHALKLSFSKKKETEQKNRKQRRMDILKGNKIVVRNLAFEANQKELKELFKPYGEVKAIRIPKKMDGQHRGFAFIEFVSSEEASQAVSALENSHFYGRKLVIEWAKQEDTNKQ